MSIIESYKNYFNATDEECLEKYFSPGRVNLIGEHIDYNGGYVFPAALSIGIKAVVGKRDDNLIVLKSSSFEQEIIINPEESIEYDDKFGWGNYPRGIYKYLKNPKKSLNIYLESNLPDGAGLSSSASLEMLIAYILSSDLLSNDSEKKDLALLGKKVENDFIGVKSGIMDQFSIVFGKKNNGILLDTNKLTYKYIPVHLKGYKLVIMNTNKKRELAGSAYNERKSQCEEALKKINEFKKIDNLCEAKIDDLKYIDDEVIKKRARHVITENQRVKNSIKVLKKDDLIKFGKLLNASHKSLKEDYEVTGKELDTIVEIAQSVDFCLGSRMTGAGFGGCAIALVKEERVQEFKKHIQKEYYNIIKLNPEFYISDINDGVKQLEEDFDE
ncbi:MAG: galactokinase [Thermotogota bacterium]